MLGEPFVSIAILNELVIIHVVIQPFPFIHCKGWVGLLDIYDSFTPHIYIQLQLLIVQCEDSKAYIHKNRKSWMCHVCDATISACPWALFVLFRV